MALTEWLRHLVAALVASGSAAVAQLVERVLGKDEVMGSSPISSSPDCGKLVWFLLSKFR